MNELTLDGKTYISSKRAAEITGYAKDYVGQLCREGRVQARLVGRNWYLLESSIRAHRFGEAEAQNGAEGADAAGYSWPTPTYKSEEPAAYIPALSERESATEAAAPQESSVITDMQSAWQEWFTQKRASNAQVAPAVDTETESQIVDEAPQAAESNDDGESRVHVTLITDEAPEAENEPVEEDGVFEETPSVYESETMNNKEEVLDLSKASHHYPKESINGASPMAEADDIEQEGIIVEEEAVESGPRFKGMYVVLQASLVALMLIAVSLTAVATGHAIKDDSYGISRSAEYRFIAGVSEYNRK